MPRDRHTRTDDVLVDVRRRAELLVRDEISNTPFGTARSLAKYATENSHIRFSLDDVCQYTAKGAIRPIQGVGFWHTFPVHIEHEQCPVTVFMPTAELCRMDT